MPTRKTPFTASSTTGATATAPTMSPLPRPSTWSAISAALELITSAVSAAKPAPHRNANSSNRGGSGSQRSSHRKAATTRATGTSAHTAPTTTPATPTLLATRPSTIRPQMPSAINPSTGPSTARR